MLEEGLNNIKMHPKIFQESVDNNKMHPKIFRSE